MATGEKPDDLKQKMGDISRPAPVPSTAIYSRTDGIAHWKTCIEEETPYTDNVEVYASHCGMGFNPAIYYVIGDRLAQPADKWRKFERSGVRCFIYPDAIYAARRPRPGFAQRLIDGRRVLPSSSRSVLLRSGCRTATSDTPPTTARHR